MTVKSGAAWADTFTCVDGTGALATPSVGPTGTLYVDGVANGATVTITGSNPYKWSVTLPALTAGQRASIYVAATIGGVATGNVLASEQADTKYPSETDATVGAIAADVTTLLSRLSAARAGYLDVLAGWTGTLRQALRAMTSKGAGEASADLTAGGGTFVNTTDSLENIKDSISAGSASAADIAAQLVGTGFAVVPQTELEPGQLQVSRYTTWVLPAIEVGTLPGTRTKLYWTVKRRTGDSDDNAFVQIEESDGLIRLARAAVEAGDEVLGSLTYAGTEATPWLHADAARQVEERSAYVWDIKYVDADGDEVVVAHGTLENTGTVTHGSG